MRMQFSRKSKQVVIYAVRATAMGHAFPAHRSIGRVLERRADDYVFQRERNTDKVVGFQLGRGDDEVVWLEHRLRHAARMRLKVLLVNALKYLEIILVEVNQLYAVLGDEFVVAEAFEPIQS